MSSTFPSGAADPNRPWEPAEYEKGGNLSSEYPKKKPAASEGESMPYAAIIGAALQLVQGNKARQQEAYARTLSEYDKKQILKGLQKTKSIEGLYSGLEEAQLKSGQKKELSGFAGAGRAIDLGALQAQQGIAARGKQNQASLEQNIVSRGLLGTSTGAQALGGLQDRISMQLAAIDQQHAQALSELGLQKSALEGGQARELAGLTARRGQFATDIATQEAALQPGKKRKKASKLGMLAEGLISGGASELFGSQVYGPSYDTSWH